MTRILITAAAGCILTGGIGYLLLPVCPVYGLAMLAVLALPPDMTDTF